MYKIIEQYDGANWRVLADARTPEGAEAQMAVERTIRRLNGYRFFATRYVVGPEGCEPLDDREAAGLPEWTPRDYDRIEIDR